MLSQNICNDVPQNLRAYRNYDAKGHASALVCIKTAPAMKARRNSQRLTAKDAFTSRTDLKVEYKTSVAF